MIRHEKGQKAQKQPASDSASTQVVDKAAVKETVLNHAGVTQPREYECELENDHNHLVYEIEFEADGLEYEYVVDARTGEILRFDKER